MGFKGHLLTKADKLVIQQANWIPKHENCLANLKDKGQSKRKSRMVNGKTNPIALGSN